MIAGGRQRRSERVAHARGGEGWHRRSRVRGAVRKRWRVQGEATLHTREKARGMTEGEGLTRPPSAGEAHTVAGHLHTAASGGT